MVRDLGLLVSVWGREAPAVLAKDSGGPRQHVADTGKPQLPGRSLDSYRRLPENRLCGLSDTDGQGFCQGVLFRL